MNSLRGLLFGVSSIAACFGLLVSGCASTCERSVCCVRGSSVTENPFDLDVDVMPKTVPVGGYLDVTYVLTNTTNEPVASCAFGWDNYSLIDAAGKSHGAVLGMSSAWPLWNDPLRLPPRAALTWKAQIEVRGGVPGRAQFVGIFQSRDGVWVGDVRSKPVEIQIIQR
jgi:hypothetical protein